MSTSENERGGINKKSGLNKGKNRKMTPAAKGLIVYLCVSAFCFIFYLVYDFFSHGVHSVYMTYLFAVPLVLGALPCVILWLAGENPVRISVNLWNSGVAAIVFASAMQGVFEIAGAESDYQVYLFYAGAAMLFGGGVAFFCGTKRGR